MKRVVAVLAPLITLVGAASQTRIQVKTMQIKIEYSAQVKRAAGVASDRLDVPDDADLQAVIRQAAEQHGADVKSILFPEGDQLHPSILVFIDDEQVRWTENPSLANGQTVVLVSPVSGG